MILLAVNKHTWFIVSISVHINSLYKGPLPVVAAINDIDFNKTYTPSFINSLNKILLLITY